MITKQKSSSQLGFYSTFEEQLDHKHPLYILGNTIDWDVFEKAFTKHYSLTMGAPSKPIRLMVSLLILKQVRNLSDESVVEQWAENSYFQYVSGQDCFCSTPPCAATELIEFRKRIGEEGIELIFKESIRINGKDAQEASLCGDTTVQEKNITYPTDDKLYKKIIAKCWKMAEKEGIELRQSYKPTIKKLKIIQRLKRNKGGIAKARKASKKIKTIAGRLTRELERKLTVKGLEKYGTELELFHRVLNQKRTDSDKIYSLHEPQVKCMSKGKEHKKYEFGSKASLLKTLTTNVIVGAMNFEENVHDSKTLQPTLDQYERLTGQEAEEVYLDRGYPGLKQIGNTQIHIPKPNKNITKSQRNKHKRRAAIEPVIGHLKQNYRLGRNFLKGSFGDSVNLMLAVAAMNFKRMMNKWKLAKASFVHFLNCIFKLIFHQLIFKIG